MTTQQVENQQQPEVKEAFNLRKRQKEIVEARKKIEDARAALITLGEMREFDFTVQGFLNAMRLEFARVIEQTRFKSGEDHKGSDITPILKVAGGTSLEGKTDSLAAAVVGRAWKLQILSEVLGEESEKLDLSNDDEELAKTMIIDAQGSLFETRVEFYLEILDELDQVVGEESPEMIDLEVIFNTCADLYEAFDYMHRCERNESISLPLYTIFNKEEEKLLSTDKMLAILSRIAKSKEGFELEEIEGKITQLGEHIDNKRANTSGEEVVRVGFKRRIESFLKSQTGMPNYTTARSFALHFGGELKDLNQAEKNYVLEKICALNDTNLVEEVAYQIKSSSGKMSISNKVLAGASLIKSALQLETSGDFSTFIELVKEVQQAANEEIGDKI